MPPKRGDRVAPPGQVGGWEARFATPENPARQHRLRGRLATHVLDGHNLDQWQYEVTSSGRIRYRPDADHDIVWVVHASPRHPTATD